MKKLSVVIPCYNEEKTLEACVQRVLEIRDDNLSIEIIIVDDCSTDGSLSIARDIENRFADVVLLQHNRNMGKGAALRTGFQYAGGDFIAVQDADLEYHPSDLKRLLEPLVQGNADVVFGSRFLSHGAHRVLYFWHYVGNRFLTLLSNMFTDINLTDMETCYKVFKREIIQKVTIEENRFGFEPEIVAKISKMRCRIYEMGISYHGRTYSEGKKISARDGFRALYCILRYNAHQAPLPVQFILYLLIGGTAACFNLLFFLLFFHISLGLTFSALLAYFGAAAINYRLCTLLLFRKNVRWKSKSELLVYAVFVCLLSTLDAALTNLFFLWGSGPGISKITASAFGLAANFFFRRFLVFPERTTPSWGENI